MDCSDDCVRQIAQSYDLDWPDRYSLWKQRLQCPEEIIKDIKAYNAADVTGGGDVQSSNSTGIGSFTRSRDWYPSRALDQKYRDGFEARVFDALAAADRHAHTNALTAVFSEQSLADARRLDLAVRGGKEVGPLAGKTIVVKDFLNVHGHRVTAGSRAFKSSTATADATVIRRLRDADAIILGMANLHALAYGALGTSSDFGPTTNPLVVGAVAGGSSSGSAVAVAVGIADIAVGTDTGGSIRAPAAACGVVGLKPTYDRIPRKGVVPLAPSLDHVGPLARTVADCASAFEVMARSDPPTCERSRSNLRGIIVGVPSTYFNEFSSAEVKAAVDDALETVVGLGARLVAVDIPSIAWAPSAQRCILGAEAFHTHYELLKKRGAELVEDVRLRLELGMFQSATMLVKAHQIRTQLRAEIMKLMSEVDLLITPTLPIPVPQQSATRVRINGTDVSAQLAMTMFSLPFNLTGQPALSLPWLSDGQGGIIAIQLVGRPMEEHFLLSVGEMLEGSRKNARLR